MDKYIKESDLFKRILNVDFKHDYDGCIKFCQSIPAADVEEVVKEWCDKRNCIIVAREDFPRLLEVRHGRWTTGRVRGSLTDICSVCGCDSGTIYHYNYCPNCGAKMDEVTE